MLRLIGLHEEEGMMAVFTAGRSSLDLRFSAMSSMRYSTHDVHLHEAVFPAVEGAVRAPSWAAVSTVEEATHWCFQRWRKVPSCVFLCNILWWTCVLRVSKQEDHEHLCSDIKKGVSLGLVFSRKELGGRSC